MPGFRPVITLLWNSATAAALVVAVVAVSCGSGPLESGSSGSLTGVTAGDADASDMTVPTAADNTTFTATEAAPSMSLLVDGVGTTGTVDTFDASPRVSSAAETDAAADTGADTRFEALTDIWGPQELTPQANQLNQDPETVEDARDQAPNPSVIRIPRLGVQAPIIALRLRDDNKIEVPPRADLAGWWLGGPEPGETGPAVILGHVDSEEGPGVFFHLRYLSNGDEIHVDRVDGSTVSYVVERLEKHGKDAFPTDAVYGPTEEPTLRLVTCGGDYDFDVRTYPDNVVVFASQVTLESQT